MSSQILVWLLAGWGRPKVRATPVSTAAKRDSAEPASASCPTNVPDPDSHSEGGLVCVCCGEMGLSILPVTVCILRPALCHPVSARASKHACGAEAEEVQGGVARPLEGGRTPQLARCWDVTRARVYLCACVSLCTCACMCVFLYVCTCAFACAHVPTLHTHVLVYAQVCTYVRVCVPVCLYTDMIMPVHVHEYTLMRVFLCVCLYHVKTCVHMCLYVCTCMRVCPGWAQTGGGSRPRACVPAGREWEKPWLTVGAHSLYIAGLCTHAAISVSLLLGQGEGRESSPPKNTARSASHAACLPRLVWNPGAVAPSLPAPSPGPATGPGSLRTLVQSGETEA